MGHSFSVRDQLVKRYFWHYGKKEIDCVLCGSMPKPTDTAIVWRDYSQYSNNGTISGAVWGKLSSGIHYLTFDGTDDSVNCGNNTITNFTSSAFTFAVWINWTASTADRNQVLVRGVADSQGYQFFVNLNGAIVLELSQAGSHNQATSTNGAVTTGNWCLICASRSTSVNPKLYRNGADVTNTTEGNTNPVTSTKSLKMGMNDAGGEVFSGSMALVRVFKRSLSAGDILTMYNYERHLFQV